MPRKIIVIDDNAINRQLLIATLSKDYDIIEAGGGAEALDLINRNYKLLSAILTDIHMPEVDGYELLRRVRENPILSTIPVIMVTGSEDEASRVKALTLGANDFIVKPFNPEIVKHCVKNNIALRETASTLNAIQKDKLTGLYNREAFFGKVDAAVKERAPGFYFISSFDIDNFKLVNDQFGAPEGDRILREIGKIVSDDMEMLGGIGGRISGDNFAVLVPMDKKEISISRIVAENRMALSDKQAIVFSVGRCVMGDTSLSASAAYDRAYIAKQSVKGRYDRHIAYFDDAMLDKLIQSQQIVTEMDTAISENQFEVWFQPQRNHSTGALVGAEALVRWRHPKKGLIPPNDFIPVFEKNGFIYELDKYVWEHTCGFLRKWLDEGRNPVPVSVNVSRVDIFRADFIEIITGLVQKYNLPSDLLRLEITESAFAQSTKKIVEIVKELIDNGFIIEIDDFGSGYSSLNTLKCVPAQVVKLDMRFLGDNDDSGRGGNILESIVRMTRWLGMSVIAEGVETKEQADYLASVGCSYIQGYYYARPMRSDDYEKYCRDESKESRLLTIDAVAHLDNNTFWSPESMDTLIFNSYVGAACIFEYNKGHIELLRVNSKFTGILGANTLSVEETLRLNWITCLTPESLALVRDILQRSAVSREEYTNEYTFLNITKDCPQICLRSTMRVIATAGGRMLVYCTSENITAQKEAERRERESAEQIRTMIHDMPGGYAQMIIKPDGSLSLAYVNDTFCKQRGMTREEMMREESKDSTSPVHPDDREKVISTIANSLPVGGTVNVKYRLICGDGNYKWFSVFGRKILDKNGNYIINAYYTDVSTQVKEEETEKALLDNLPVGAGIYELKNNRMTLVYQNKSYWELVGLKCEAYPDPEAMSAVHPDDIPVIMQELTEALTEGHDVACDIRLRHLTDGYHYVHLSGRVVFEKDGGFLIYTTFTPISDETMAIQKTLPIAIRAIMNSSPSFAFIKDKNLRYMGCSHKFAEFAGVDSESFLIGKCSSDVFSPMLAAESDAIDRNILETKESSVNKDIIYNSGKGSIHLRFSKYPLTDRDGNILGIFGTGYDVTESLRMQSRLEALTNSVPGGIAIYEGKPDELDKIKLTYFSDGFARLYGYTREEYERLTEKDPLRTVYSGDISKMYERILALVRDGVQLDYIYRAKVNGGAMKYINVKAVMGEPNGDNLTVNAVFFDVTEEKEAMEKLRISEEVNRLAVQQSGKAVCRYDIPSNTIQLPENVNPIFSFPVVVKGMPDSVLNEGVISSETSGDYISFFKNIHNGEKQGKGLFQLKSSKVWRWIDGSFTTIFSEDGKPSTSVISFSDVTNDIERNMAYHKWQQTLKDKNPDSYSIFHCNITKDTILDESEGTLIPNINFNESAVFSERNLEYSNARIYSEDRDRFLSVMDRSIMLMRHRQGRNSDSLEYREKMADGSLRWMHLTLDLIELPSSDDVEAYIMFENIDKSKRAELDILERAENDPLTGLLNRKTFENKLAALINSRKQNEFSALFIIDLDGFKLINDSFGHASGDETLIELSQKLRASFRKQDLVCRLGGDEFVVFMPSISDINAIRNKAELLCDVLHKSFGSEVELSASIGVSVCPEDGNDFEQLYRKADIALYHVKEAGKNGYSVYSSDMCEKPQTDEIPAVETERVPSENITPKHRMLIVEDNEINRDYLQNLFDDEFIIETAAEGTAALTKLRRYGAGISVVLLDLMMPGLDGFAVLKKMRENQIMQSIPVIVVSGMNEREACLRAISEGASDYITKPVDADILKLRVESVLSRAENEQLRAKNRYLAMQNEEAKRLADAKRHSEELSVALHAAERADLAKGQFLSSMSHEIRTPLNAVIGYNTIAKNEINEAKTDEERRLVTMKVLDCLTKSEVASRHLLTIINDVLDISAIESGKMKVDSSPFDFKNLISSLTVMFFSQARAKGVNFEVLFDKPTEEWFVGDQLRVNQVLTNLLSNAVKFTPEGGNVTLTVTESIVDEKSTAFCFTVADTGIGMTQEYLTHIWTPFEQEEASISRRFGGTGLGLSITKNLVEMMGGEISVESESGVGSRFTVRLSLARMKQPVKSLNYDFSGVNALVVDDDVNTCDYIKLLFDRCGARCLTFTSGKDAVCAFSAAKEQGEPFNVCLVDWRMPQMDGFATISEIRRISAKKLPVVVVTAYDFSEVAEQAEKLGINKFISKPLFQSSLFDLLANVCGRQIPVAGMNKSTYNFGGARILLAEDNNMNMEVAKHILLSAGIEVDSAWNGQEAVDIFTASKPGTYKTVLMDVHMPELDGYAATRMIRASSHPDAKSVPIIAMTADVFAEDVAEAHSAGMNDHISKPIDIESMFKKLKKYLGE